MRKMVPIAAGLGLAVLLAGCGASKGLSARGPNEFEVAREAPLVIPPDYALKPPQPGVARPQDNTAQQQALAAMFGGPAPRSTAETATLDAAGQDSADPGIRSEVGDPQTNVVDKGGLTPAIEAAPQGDGKDARVSVPQ